MAKQWEWVPKESRRMVAAERRRIGRLRGKTVSDVRLNGKLNELEVLCTDGSVVSVRADMCNSGNASMSINLTRKW